MGRMMQMRSRTLTLWLFGVAAAALVVAPAAFGMLAARMECAPTGVDSCCVVEVEPQTPMEACCCCCEVEAPAPERTDPEDRDCEDCTCPMSFSSQVRIAMIDDSEPWGDMEFGVEAEWLTTDQTLTPRDVQLSLLRPPRI